MYSNKDNINILTSLLVSYGITHVVVCPGSRNAPLVHNFSEHPGIVCHPVTDERSAGFIALGLRLQLKEQVAVCVTSGSALLNLLPAAAEASYQHQGIIIISADRPQAWIDQLDGQTIPQPDALGRFVKKSVNLPEPHDMTDVWHCRRLVCEALMENMVTPYPSVHINVPITEPLFDFSKETLPELSGIIPCRWSDESEKEYILNLVKKAERPMIVIGQLPDDGVTSWNIHKLRESMVVLCEQLSFIEHTFTDQMIYALPEGNEKEEYQPDLVMFFGGHTVSKRLRLFLRGLSETTEVLMVSEDRQLHDISQHATCLIAGEASTVLEDLSRQFKKKLPHQSDFYHTWQALEEEIRTKHEAFQPEYSQMLAAKIFEAYADSSNNVADSFYYANSMSVRLAALYANHYCYCNRGINGIEGSLSVAAGAALAKATCLNNALTPNISPLNTTDDNITPKYSPLGEPEGAEGAIYCVIGDLSFFYDENALWQQQLGGNFRILLLNNSQGGIFRNLKGLEQSPVRDAFISARHTASAEGICRQFNVTYLKATDEESLRSGIIQLTSMPSARPVLLEVLTDVNIDEEQFKKYYQQFRTSK